MRRRNPPLRCAEEVLEVYHAGQPVEVAAGGGVERVGFPADQLADLCGRHGGVYPCDFAAVRHDRTHLAVAEREYAADDLLFDDLHLSVFGSLLNDRLDLLLGDLALRIPYSEQAGDSSMLRESSHTKGDVTLASTCIGRATSMATRSALFMPMRLGTSSPKTIVR